MWHRAVFRFHWCMLATSILILSRADDDSHGFVGYLKASNCWDETLGVTHDLCCHGQEDRCFGSWSDMYEPCCLHQNTLPKGSDLVIDAFRVAEDEPWSHLGGDVDLDGFIATIAHSGEVGPWATPLYHSIIFSGCCEARIAALLKPATERAGWELLGILGKYMQRLQERDLHWNGNTATDIASSVIESVRRSVASILNEGPLNDAKSSLDMCRNSTLARCWWTDWGHEILPLHVQLVHNHLNKMVAVLDRDNKHRMNRLPSVKPVLQGIDKLNQANTHLAVRFARLQQTLDQTRLGRFPLSLLSRFRWENRFCCRFVNVVEGVARDVFLSDRRRAVRVVELGVNLGIIGLHLLSRYAWVSYVGVDTLQGPSEDYPLDHHELRARFTKFSSRARLLVPMNTSVAAKLLRREGLRFDVLVLDARFDHVGLNADVATWLRLLSPGGYAISRASKYLGALWQQRLLPEELHFCTSVDGLSVYHRVF